MWIGGVCMIVSLPFPSLLSYLLLLDIFFFISLTRVHIAVEGFLPLSAFQGKNMPHLGKQGLRNFPLFSIIFMYRMWRGENISQYLCG